MGEWKVTNAVSLLCFLSPFTDSGNRPEATSYYPPITAPDFFYQAFPHIYKPPLWPQLVRQHRMQVNWHFSPTSNLTGNSSYMHQPVNKILLCWWLRGIQWNIENQGCYYFALFLHLLVASNNKQFKIAHAKSWFISKMLPLSHEIQRQKVKLKVTKLKNKVVVFSKKRSLYHLFTLCMLEPLCSLCSYILPVVWKGPIPVTTSWSLRSVKAANSFWR